MTADEMTARSLEIKVWANLFAQEMALQVMRGMPDGEDATAEDFPLDEKLLAISSEISVHYLHARVEGFDDAAARAWVEAAIRADVQTILRRQK